MLFDRSPIKALENNSMAITHICLNCARDLARQPALRDPHYSLPLVICPDCNKVSVRRPNHYSAQYKSMLRGITIFFTLLFHTLFIITFAAITIGWVFLISNVVFGINGSELTHLSVTNVIVAFALTSIATGAWLTAGFSHIPKLKVWICWTLFLLFIFAITLITKLLSESIHNVNVAINSFEVNLVIASALITIITIMIIAITGIPLGKFFLYLHRIIARERWQWRKRRRTLGRTK